MNAQETASGARKIARRFSKNEEGGLIFSCLVAVLGLALLVGYLLDVGAETIQREKLQRAADSVAYSSGVWLARGMNATAAINHLMGQKAAYCAMLQALSGPETDFAPCEEEREMIALLNSLKLRAPQEKTQEWFKVREAINHFADLSYAGKSGRHIAGGACYDAQMTLKYNATRCFNNKAIANALIKSGAPCAPKLGRAIHAIENLFLGIDFSASYGGTSLVAEQIRLKNLEKQLGATGATGSGPVCESLRNDIRLLDARFASIVGSDLQTIQQRTLYKKIHATVDALQAVYGFDKCLVAPLDTLVSETARRAADESQELECPELIPDDPGELISAGAAYNLLVAAVPTSGDLGKIALRYAMDLGNPVKMTCDLAELFAAKILGSATEFFALFTPFSPARDLLNQTQQKRVEQVKRWANAHPALSLDDKCSHCRPYFKLYNDTVATVLAQTDELDARAKQLLDDIEEMRNQRAVEMLDTALSLLIDLIEGAMLGAVIETAQTVGAAVGGLIGYGVGAPAGAIVGAIVGAVVVAGAGVATILWIDGVVQEKKKELLEAKFPNHYGKTPSSPLISATSAFVASIQDLITLVTQEIKFTANGLKAGSMITDVVQSFFTFCDPKAPISEKYKLLYNAINAVKRLPVNKKFKDDLTKAQKKIKQNHNRLMAEIRNFFNEIKLNEEELATQKKRLAVTKAERRRIENSLGNRSTSLRQYVKLVKESNRLRDDAFRLERQIKMLTVKTVAISKIRGAVKSKLESFNRIAGPLGKVLKPVFKYFGVAVNVVSVGAVAFKTVDFVDNANLRMESFEEDWQTTWLLARALCKPKCVEGCDCCSKKDDEAKASGVCQYPLLPVLAEEEPKRTGRSTNYLSNSERQIWTSASKDSSPFDQLPQAPWTGNDKSKLADAMEKTNDVIDNVVSSARTLIDFAGNIMKLSHKPRTRRTGRRYVSSANEIKSLQHGFKKSWAPDAYGHRNNPSVWSYPTGLFDPGAECYSQWVRASYPTLDALRGGLRKNYQFNLSGMFSTKFDIGNTNFNLNLATIWRLLANLSSNFSSFAAALTSSFNNFTNVSAVDAHVPLSNLSTYLTVWSYRYALSESFFYRSGFRRPYQKTADPSCDMYVVAGTDEPRKGTESFWNNPQAIDEMFTVCAVVQAPTKAPVAAPRYFKRFGQDRAPTAIAQALFYPKNGRKTTSNGTLDDAGNRAKHRQPNTAWDTLQWKNQNPDSPEVVLATEWTNPNVKTGPKARNYSDLVADKPIDAADEAKIELSWRTQLCPVSKGRLDKVVDSFDPKATQTMKDAAENASDYYELIQH